MRRLLVDLTPLRISRPYRNLWAGALLSSIGYAVSTVTVGLQVFDMTGSTFAVGVLGFVSLVPLVLLGLYGGSVIDAYDRKRVLLISLAVSIVVATCLSVLALTGLTRVGLVYGLVAINSGMLGLYQPARQTVVPRLIPDRLLPATVALATLSGGVAMILGPALAGLVVENLGYGAAHLVQTTFCIGAFALLFTLPTLVPEGEPRRAGLRSVAEGLAYLKKRPTLGMTFVVDLCAMVMAMPMVLFPAIGALASIAGEATAAIIGGVACVVTVLTVSLRQKGLLGYDARRPLDVS